MATLLEPTSGYVNAGESAVITVTLYDTDAETLAKAAILTLTATLTDDYGNTINSRENQSVLDANQGTVSSAGVLTLKLTPADNAMQNTAELEELHKLQLTWTWQDGAGDTLTGKDDIKFKVRQFPLDGATVVGAL